MQYYIKEKAKNFLQSGYLLYRNKDFFHLPPVDLAPDEHQALYDICQQVIENKGFESFIPISASLAHMHLFLEMIHFRVVAQDEESIEIKHIITTHQPEVLYCIFTDMRPPVRSPFPFSWGKSEKIEVMYPLVPYQPMIISSRLLKSGVIGSCWYQLHVDCTTDSSIQYQSLLLCMDPYRHQPCFVVSEEIGVDCLFFCSFDAQGHHNLGECNFDTVDDFFERAMPLVEKFFAKTPPQLSSEE